MQRDEFASQWRQQQRASNKDSSQKRRQTAEEFRQRVENGVYDHKAEEARMVEVTLLKEVLLLGGARNKTRDWVKEYLPRLSFRTVEGREEWYVLKGRNSRGTPVYEAETAVGGTAG